VCHNELAFQVHVQTFLFVKKHKHQMISTKHLRRHLIYKSKKTFKQICLYKKLRASKNCRTYKLLVDSIWFTLFPKASVPLYINERDINSINWCVNYKLEVFKQMTQASLMTMMNPQDSLVTFVQKMNLHLTYDH